LIKVGRRLPLHRESNSSLTVGEWVEVRSKQEILSTLDERGELESLPFMPEMFAFCGKRFRVFRRAHKTCDTVNKTGGRRVHDTVHLEGVRCDGAGHAGCQAACLIFWKNAWLMPVAGPEEARARNGASRPNGAASARSTDHRERQVLENTVQTGADGVPVYSCQTTRLPAATSLLHWWDVRQYAEDYVSGNVTLGQLANGFAWSGFNKSLRLAFKLRTRAALKLVDVYDQFQTVRRGVPFPRRMGAVPIGQRTPRTSLGLKAGELVRIKSYPEILATLDNNNKNRGMFFDAEEVPYCGGTYRVRSRVECIIDECTGKMIAIKDSVILENVWCKAHYSDRRMFCPRAMYSFWKEVWLERVSEQGTTLPARNGRAGRDGHSVGYGG
jgi:hypothetical protein